MILSYSGIIFAHEEQSELTLQQNDIDFFLKFVEIINMENKENSHLTENAVQELAFAMDIPNTRVPFIVAKIFIGLEIIKDPQFVNQIGEDAIHLMPTEEERKLILENYVSLQDAVQVLPRN
ncbi:MAG: hypothetical protein LBF22_01730 [Deltaproteobacteria bacterium]|nr:hypothetical protein [Deltaproteobacteria bacterium]